MDNPAVDPFPPTRRYERLKGIYQLQRRLARERNNASLPALIVEETRRLLDVDRGSLFLYEAGTSELRLAHADGLSANSVVVPLRMGVIGAAILRRERINIINAYQHAFFCTTVDASSGYRTDSVLAAPIITSAGQLLGGVQLINKLHGRFGADDERQVDALAARLAAHSQAGRIPPDLAGREMMAVQQSIGCDRSAVFQLDEAAGQLVSIYASGMDGQIVLSAKLGIAGLVALTGTTLIVADPAHDPRFDASVDKRTGYQTRNILAVPLKGVDGETLGVIQLINKQAGDFTAEDVDLLETLAGTVAIMIENGNLVRDIDRQFHSFLEAMAASLDARDDLTAGHSQRVAQIAERIAKVLAFAEDDLDILRVAAMLHDYGKIGVDDAVLRKNGKLDDGEYRHMKAHASTTFEILEKVHFASKYRSVPLIASSHHETLDGSGYPRGLKSHELPFMTKILTVADVYEALTADRHYRQGMSQADALAILDAGVGTKFEGRIVAALREALAG